MARDGRDGGRDNRGGRDHGRERDRDGDEHDRQARHHQPRGQGGEGRPAASPSPLWWSWAIRRGASATARARRAKCRRRSARRPNAPSARMIRVPMKEGRTLHHDMEGALRRRLTWCCAQRPAGTGIIAGGPMRAVFETLGIGDVVAKIARQPQSAQHGQGDVRCPAEMLRQPAHGRGPSRQKGFGHPRLPERAGRRRNGGDRRCLIARIKQRAGDADPLGRSAASRARRRR